MTCRFARPCRQGFALYRGSRLRSCRSRISLRALKTGTTKLNPRRARARKKKHGLGGPRVYVINFVETGAGVLCRRVDVPTGGRAMEGCSVSRAGRRWFMS